MAARTQAVIAVGSSNARTSSRVSEASADNGRLSWSDTVQRLDVSRTTSVFSGVRAPALPPRTKRRRVRA